MPTQTVDCGRITSSCTDERNCQQILLETFSTKVHSCGPSPFFNSVFIFLILLTTSSLYAPPPALSVFLLHADLACSVTDLLFRVYCCVI